MLKVLHIISSMNPCSGGVCQAVRSYIYGMKDITSIDNEVLCLDHPDSEYIKSEKSVIYSLGMVYNYTSWNYNKILKSWLKSNLSNYDIIIVHGLWQYQTYAVYQVLKRVINRPKLLVMPHGMLDPYFQKAKGRKVKAIRNTIFWKLIESKLINLADGVLFTCEEEKLLARQPFTPYYPKREVVIGLGVESPPVYDDRMTQSFFEKCVGWNQKPFLLFLSRIHEKKGVDLLVKSYLKIKKENADIPQLVIAGPGIDTPYGQEIVKLAEGDKDILFPGMLSGENKWGAFYNCGAFILPSHQENFGIAIVEAMACEKAVLITDKVNIWRDIEKNRAGLVAVDTEDNIYKMLKDWLSLSILEQHEIGMNARNTYLESFSIEKASEKMVSVLS
ncbi:MAG: glycosyltransferase [Dysgonomonas sp.]